MVRDGTDVLRDRLLAWEPPPLHWSTAPKVAQTLCMKWINIISVCCSMAQNQGEFPLTKLLQLSNIQKNLLQLTFQAPCLHHMAAICFPRTFYSVSYSFSSSPNDSDLLQKMLRVNLCLRWMESAHFTNPTFIVHFSSLFQDELKLIFRCDFNCGWRGWGVWDWCNKVTVVQYWHFTMLVHLNGEWKLVT
jgi:hypothetical protein